MENQLPDDIQQGVVKATGWAPIKVFATEDKYIPIVMPDGTPLYVKLDDQGKFLRVVSRPWMR